MLHKDFKFYPSNFTLRFVEFTLTALYKTSKKVLNFYQIFSHILPKNQAPANFSSPYIFLKEVKICQFRN